MLAKPVPIAIAALVLAHLPFAARAAVMERDLVPGSGDGLLTFDDVNQREWLDLTESQLFKFPGDTLEDRYQAVVAETLPGGMFDEFTIAASSDVLALAESGGLVIATTDFDINKMPADSLITLLGNPVLGANSANKWAAGFLNNSILSESLAIAYVPFARSRATAGITLTNFLASGNGVWLYREIPEPTSLALVLAYAALLLALPRVSEHES